MSDISGPVHLAVDLGASSGRVLGISCGDSELMIDVLHRFHNHPLPIGKHLYWNHLALWDEIQQGLTAAASKFAGQVHSVGVDTWGVDYVLLDAEQMPIGPGFCYRDNRNCGMMEKAFERLSRAEIFAETGIQFMQINTLYQLLASRLSQSKLMNCGESFLMVPDFFHWLMSGTKVNEVTNASTTQMLQPRTQQWSSKIIDKMDFDARWFQTTTQPGTNLGQLTSIVQERTGLNDIPVICPATHDTASAVLAIPIEKFKESQPKWGYISSGTWSLMGVELDAPNLSERCLELNFTNEAGPDGSIRLLKNIAGLWPLQQVREEQLRKGMSLTWDDMIAHAQNATPLQRFVNLDDARLINPGNMTNAILGMLDETSQSRPGSDGEMTRLILESLAMRYRVCLGWLEQLLGYQLESLYIMGGGVQNQLLCQMTADATNRQVITAHAESTAVGNALMQAIGTGRFGSIVQARSWLANTIQLKTFEPQNVDRWSEAYDRCQRSICG